MHLSVCSHSLEKLWTDQKEHEVARVGSCFFFFIPPPFPSYKAVLNAKSFYETTVVSNLPKGNLKAKGILFKLPWKMMHIMKRVYFLEC